MSLQTVELAPPARISVVRPLSLDALRQVVATTPAPHYFLAGGTDLLVAHKDGKIPSSSWIDLTALPELGGVELRGAHVRIGALAVHEEIQRSPVARQLAPALVEACSVIGGPQIRWRGTIGGNLANGSPAADTVPALHTLEARVEILSPDGTLRRVDVGDFATAPRKTVLADGQLIVAVWFPARAALRGGFMRLGQRQSQAISKVSVAVSAIPKGDGGDGHGGFKTAFSYLRIACGSVAPTVIRATRAEQILLEGGLTPETLLQAMAAVREEVTPIDDVRSTRAYRREMTGVLLRRVLEKML